MEYLRGSSNGRTGAFEALNLGSSPSPLATSGARARGSKQIDLLMARTRKPFPYEQSEWKRCTDPVRIEIPSLK
jgi:hypothetical protein